MDLVKMIKRLIRTAEDLDMDNISFMYYDAELKTDVKVSLLQRCEWDITTVHQAKDKFGIWEEITTEYEIEGNELIEVNQYAEVL